MIGHILSHALSNQNCCCYCTAFWLRLKEVRQCKDVLAEISLTKCSPPFPPLKSTNCRESTVSMPTWTIHAIIPPHHDSPHLLAIALYYFSFPPLPTLQCQGMQMRKTVWWYWKLCAFCSSQAAQKAREWAEGQRQQWGGGVENDKVDLSCWVTFSELVLCKDTCEIKEC